MRGRSGGMIMFYGLHDKPPWGVALLAALQWLIVTVSTTVMVPLVVGDVYRLQPDEISRFMQQTLFFAGLASFLQVWIGHRYPMMEAPAGLWWGIFIIMAQIGESMGLQPRLIGQSLQLGVLLAGVMFVGLGIAGGISKIQQWFTPLVTGTYMILLAVSLCSKFVAGMMGIGFQQSEQVSPGVAFVSLAIIACVVLVMRVPKLASLAVLIGIVSGWAGYALLGWTQPVSSAPETFVLPSLLFWGPMHWNGGVVLTSLLTGFVLLTNLITSTAVVGRAAGQPPTAREYNQGGIFTGVSHVLAGIAGVVGMIPLSLAAAVIETTKMAARLPFMIAMLVMMVIGMLPGVSLFLAGIPTPVAYAAMFVSFTQLIGFGLKDLAAVKLDQRAITIVGSSLLLGIGMLFVPASAWKQLHPLFSFLFGNGLLLGVLVCLLLEHLIFRIPQKQSEQNGSCP